MNSATETITASVDVTSAKLGSKFTRWGLGLFVLGFALGFIPILHYMHGAVAGDVGPDFLKNMTLWWGCPAVLMEYTLKTGGLGMVCIGLCYLVLPRVRAEVPVSANERLAPGLCLVGLLGATVYMSIGYVICNLIWPNFYFQHVETGKDVWLAGQLIGIAIYFYGIAIAFGCIRRYHLSV